MTKGRSKANERKRDKELEKECEKINAILEKISSEEVVRSIREDRDSR